VKTFQVADPAQQLNQRGREIVLMLLGTEAL
jgi:hypothetical protein